MGSIDVGRPPDGDSCSDDDETSENSVIGRAERDQQTTSPYCSPAHWTPRALSFRSLAPRSSQRRGNFLQHGGAVPLQVVVTRPLVARLTKDITETYQICNPTFAYSLSFNPKRYLTNPSSGVSNGGLDNVNSDLVLYVNGVLVNSDCNRRYVVKDILGQGTFGQVCKCWTDDSNSYVAVKVIKNQPAYYHQAHVEIGICHMLNHQFDPGDNHNIVRILDHFVYEGHLCLVFELLNSNLYELLKLNNFRGLSMMLVRRFTKQMLEALMVLRDASVIHCDLKPENILLSQSLESAEIKLIDFGSACMENRTVYSYIQSRFYRSPEVLLGHQYTTAIDMWSLGCVAAELFLGLPLFPGASEYDLMQRMIETLGNQPPDNILRAAKNTSKFFKHTSAAPHLSCQKSGDGQSTAYYLLNETEYEAREQKKPNVGKRYFAHKRLEEIIVNYPLRRRMNQEEIDAETQTRLSFIDFLKGLVHFDPVKRWTPRQAVQHPFLTEDPFLGPYRPVSETPRSRVGHGMAVEHNPGTGHWFGAGLSPQINPGLNRFNSQFNGPSYSFASSYGSLGSYGSYGDGVGLGSSFGSYGDPTGMYMSYPTAPSSNTGMNNGQNQGAGGSASLGVSPDTWRRMTNVPNMTQLGMSPSSSGFRPMSLGASPSHHPSSNSQFQASPGSAYQGSPGSSFLPSPGSAYQASPGSAYQGSPASQFLASPGSPSSVSPGRYGPTSPARGGVGTSTLGKSAVMYNHMMNKRRGWPVPTPTGDSLSSHRQRLHQANANDSDGGVEGGTRMGSSRSGRAQGVPHPSRAHRSGSSSIRPQSSNAYPLGSLGALLNSPDTVSEAGEDVSPPPNPADWDPNYSDEVLLQNDTGDPTSSHFSGMDLNDGRGGMNRSGAVSGQRVNPSMMGYHQGNHLAGNQSRGIGPSQSGSLSSNLEGNSLPGMQSGYGRPAPKHGLYAPQQTSPSRLGPNPNQHRHQHQQQQQHHQHQHQQHYQLDSHQSPEALPSLAPVNRNHGVAEASGLLPSPRRGGISQGSRGTSAGAPGGSGADSHGPPGTGFPMTTGVWLPNMDNLSHLSGHSPIWTQHLQYSIPQGFPHHFSSMGQPSLVTVAGRPLPPNPSRQRRPG